MSDALAASEVRARLFESLEPLTRGVLALLPEGERAGAFERLRLIVRPFALPGETPGMRVFLMLIEPDDSAVAGRVLSGGLVASMLNRAAVEAAVEDVLGAILAMLGEDAAADALKAAEWREASLLVQARPATGAVYVVSVPRPEQERPPLVLGALVDAPAVAH
jgi:hypothetical protein